MTTGHDYSDLLSAASGLLGRVVEVASSVGPRFAVIGGWSPFLLNPGPMGHPGTRDVDLLFEDGVTVGALKEVVRELTRSGFMPSAKHDFQLLHVLRVGGVDFVFNVDLLHASEARKNPDLFVDHVALPIRVSEFGAETVPIRSIVVPLSGFIFDGHVESYTHSYLSPSGGEPRETSVPLMDELGTLVTKAESMQMKKRRRDAFDLVVAVRQVRDRPELERRMRGLQSRHPDAFAELSKLWALTTERSLRENVTVYWTDAADDTTWAKVREEIRSLLESGGVPRLDRASVRDEVV